MKKLKKTTVAMLLSTMVFANLTILTANAEKVDLKENKTIVQVQAEKSTGEIVTIPDISLRKSIYKELDKDMDSKLTKTELEQITKLDIIGTVGSVSNLEGLQYCTNLQRLDLRNGEIKDISPLSGLVNLQFLNLWGNNISDISPLSGLINLQKLFLFDNNISDISALSGLVNLQALMLNSNNIKDIGALSRLTNLEALTLDRNNVSDISALSELVELTFLDLRDNDIKDITPLLNLDGNSKSYENIVKLDGNSIDFSYEKMMSVIEYLKDKYYTVSYSNQQNVIKLSDIDKHWAKNEIKEFVSLGYIAGYSDGTFKPDAPITRAEFIKTLNRAFGLTQTSGKVFEDTKNHWAKNEVDIAYTNGVCEGISPTKFNPDGHITRQEVAKMVVVYKNSADKNHDKLNAYIDKNLVDSWALDYVEGAIEKGYMQGSNGKFNPTGKITRSEAVTTLGRIN